MIYSDASGAVPQTQEVRTQSGSRARVLPDFTLEEVETVTAHLMFVNWPEMPKSQAQQIAAPRPALGSADHERLRPTTPSSPHPAHVANESRE